jgi:hypothetical protein
MPAYSQDIEPAELPQTAPLPEERPGESETGDVESVEPEAEEPEGEEQEEPTEPPAPEDAPLPEERPEPPEDTESEQQEEDESATSEEDSGAAEDESGATAPENDATQEDDAEAEDEEPEEPVKREPSPPEPEDQAALRACRAALAGFGTEFEEIDPILPEGIEQDGCGVAKPFSVSEILPGIELRPATAMRCETALKLARWVKNEVLPAARVMKEHGDLVALDHGSTYVCRPRNGVDGADISEHAKGNAVDIMSFTFEDGRTVPVSPKEGDGTAAEVFQKASASGACLYFSTVLGPGADVYHDDHLHLDIADRESEYLLCQAP